MTEQQSTYEGWAILEIFGHQKYAGFVKTEYFGTACMFRCDVPPLPEREQVSRGGCYVDDKGEDVRSWAPAGSKVKKVATIGYTKLFGVGAIYSPLHGLNDLGDTDSPVLLEGFPSQLVDGFKWDTLSCAFAFQAGFWFRE